MSTSITTSHSGAPRDGASPRLAARAAHLVKTYGTGEAAVHALNGYSVDIAAAQFTAVMGPSGSGKSTLMHCLAALDTPTSGEVWIGDTQIAGGSRRANDKALTKLRRERLGFIFQSFNLLPTLTALDNILLPTQLAGAKHDAGWLDEIVTTLNIQDRLGHRPGELSGGQQQRVAVARALLSRPDVVFADEPTGALDTASGTDLLEFLQRSVREFGQTMVMVTHDPVAAAYADRVVLLADGQAAGEIDHPTRDSVIDAMRGLGA